MSSSYVSARFEKTDLYTEIGQQRCIVRNLADGPVPPVPSPTYFPTQPFDLTSCFTVQYVDDSIGERLLRASTLNDINNYVATPLTQFVDPTKDFIAASVTPGDVLQVYLASAAEWTSEEYPSGLFQFTVVSVASTTRLTVNAPFPSFKAGLNWEISSRSLVGVSTGVTRRDPVASPGAIFRDRRFNTLWPSSPQMDAFVSATKAQLDALGQTSTSTTQVSENYTSRARSV